MYNMNRERDYSLDIIRIFATFTVISVHFFLNNGFYQEIIDGPEYYLMCIMRNFFGICVPLFILLTGYLMGRKTLSRKYYSGITKTLVIYVFASIACIIYKNSAGQTAYDLKHAIFAIFDFTGTTYSWYIEMYIGLFLLIPFLNLIFQNLDQKGRTILIITLFFMTSIPTVINIYNFDTAGWWLNPACDKTYQKILPFWWGNFWPLTYYFIGSYLKEHPPKFNWKIAFPLLILITAAAGSFAYYRSHGTAYVSGTWQGWNGLLNVILSCLVFFCLLQFKSVNRAPKAVKCLLKYLSDFTLGAYLVSCIFDLEFYKTLNEKVPDLPDKTKYYFVIVPLSFLCSMLLSALLNLIYYLIKHTVRKLKSHN